MVEQLIYFALGCIVTALCALMFAPVFWSRALRLTRQRMQLQIPVSMQEIYAERDGLRAEFAVERLRLEQELERVRDAKGRDLAEIGKRSMDVARLTEDLATARRDGEARMAEAAALQRTLDEREAQPVAAQGEPSAETPADGARVRALEQELASTRNALLEAREREKSFHIENGMKVRGTDRAAAERLEQLRSENAALRGELEAARRDAPATDAREDGGLRESIHALGLAVAAMTRDSRAAEKDDSPGKANVDAR